MINEAVQQSKEIDQRTIKEMLQELAGLTEQLKIRDDEMKALKITFESEQLKRNSSNGISEETNETHSTHIIQKRSNDEAHQIGLVYAFLYGGIAMMFITSLIPWFFSFVNNLNSVSDSVQSMDGLEIEEEY
jgi:hypothetical protein